MRRVGASFMAMTAGWLVMNLIGVPMMTPFHASSMLWWAFFSSFVVAAAWLVIYLPIYALLPTRSVFWKWTVCIPLGVLVAALIPLVVFRVVDGGISGTDWGTAAVFSAMAAIVGGVAAAVGRSLFPWSRNYEMQWPDRKRAESSKPEAGPPNA